MSLHHMRRNEVLERLNAISNKNICLISFVVRNNSQEMISKLMITSPLNGV